MSGNRNLFKSAGIVSFFTLVSRVLGYLRDIIIAFLFGTGTAAQAFVVAFRIPNTLRHLVGEGGTNAAIIPILTEYLEKDSKQFWRLANILLNLLVIILASITIIGVVLSPLLVRIIAFGFMGDAEKLELTIRLTRIMFSFIFFIGLAAYMMGILNSLKHFAAPSAGSCLLNITMIVFGLWVCPRLKEPIIGMAVAVLIGGFLQVVVQIPVLLHKGFRFDFSLGFKHPAVQRIGKLFLPRIIGSSIYQLSIFADTMFASLGSIVGETAVAVLYFANRLIQFPIALFGNAMATACLPTMSRLAVTGDMDKLKETLIIALRSLLIVLVPSSIGLFVLAVPIVGVLFERGKFDVFSTQLTAGVLMFYCLGLFAYSAAKVTSTCFYALKDTLTPVKITLGCLVLNIVLNIILMRPLQVGGLALATSISSLVNFFILILVLERKIGALDFKKTITLLFPVLISSLIMGLACWISYNYWHDFLSKWLSLLFSILTGIVVYVGLGWMLGIFKGFRLRYEPN